MDKDYTPYGFDDPSYGMPRDSRLEKAAENLEVILKQLYSKQDLDVVQFENDLDELCICLGVEPVYAEIQIQRNPGLKPKKGNFFSRETLVNLLKETI